MARKPPIFYSALLLTGVNLLLRFVSTSFQVYLSGRIGAAGVGLLQLVLSVGSLAMTAGIAGIRTSTMYLCAEELGKNRSGNVRWVLSSCFCYSILASGAVSLLLYSLGPWIANNWIGDSRTLEAIRLFAGFLPVSCLCGVMTGYFTAANRIGTLAAVEVAEQLVCMGITVGGLSLWAGSDPGRACQCVVFGSGAGALFTLVCLTVLRLREKAPVSGRFPMAKRLIHTALPLAVADDVKSGLSTAENLMVPKRLGLYPLSLDPLAEFGTVCAMVFPVMMFPAAILYGLAELLIPELARCNASGSRNRIRYLATRSLRTALLYGCFFCGIGYLIAMPLCQALYGSTLAGSQLRLYTILIPILYCDAITDAMNKGLGQQAICMRYNILTALMDLLGLFFLLPSYGMTGYFISFTVSHLVNFLLSIRLLAKVSGIKPMIGTALVCLVCTAVGTLLCKGLSGVILPILCFTAIWGSLLVLCRVISLADLRWLKQLITAKGKALSQTE